MTRTVLSPVDFDSGEITYQVPTGWNSATLLPLLNTSVAPGLKQWDPDRWTRHRLTEQSVLPSPVLVTAFGHGRHSCPAQPFSLVAMTAAMTHLLREYQMTAGWTASATGTGPDRWRGVRKDGVWSTMSPGRPRRKPPARAEMARA
jgi:cytochrome P450